MNHTCKFQLSTVSTCWENSKKTVSVFSIFPRTSNPYAFTEVMTVTTGTSLIAGCSICKRIPHYYGQLWFRFIADWESVITDWDVLIFARNGLSYECTIPKPTWCVILIEYHHGHKDMTHGILAMQYTALLKNKSRHEPFNNLNTAAQQYNSQNKTMIGFDLYAETCTGTRLMTDCQRLILKVIYRLLCE